MACRTFLRFFVLAAVLSAAMIPGCGDKSVNPPKPPDLPSITTGRESTLEIMTWNIESFPKQGQATIDRIVDVIDTLDVDIIAVQEIADTTAFRTLIRALDGYQGLYSPDVYDPGEYQKTGLLYKESVVTVGDHFPIFTDSEDSWAFPRPPMKYNITVNHNDRQFEFRLIVMHLKAGGTDTDLARRREAASRLKEYLDERLQYDTVKDYAVAGDWNDEIDDALWFNAFNVFTQSNSYYFLTTPLAGNNRYASYPGLNALIDHILVSADMMEEYYLGITRTERLDDLFSDYVSVVSDHRPVMAMFPIF
jgi:endonuclease/exonuclease/phosphatase family metal-dependent hydrolase